MEYPQTAVEPFGKAKVEGISILLLFSSPYKKHFDDQYENVQIYG